MQPPAPPPLQPLQNTPDDLHAQSELPLRPAGATRNAVLLSLVITAVYACLYQFEPLPQPWNDNAIYALTILVANLAAVLGTRVWQQFLPGETPRQMWLFFSLGLWSWGSGEVVWLVVHTWWPEHPDTTIIDAFWVAAYICWAVALFYQYRLILRTNAFTSQRWLALLGTAVLGLTLLVTTLARARGIGADWTWLGMYLAIFYPIGDLLLGLAALDLSRRFSSGLWGRAWWGLIIFAISDGITGWYYLGGYQLLTPAADMWLSLFTDVLYFGAYVVFALACYMQLLLLRFGPPRHKTKAANELMELSAEVL